MRGTSLLFAICCLSGWPALAGTLRVNFTGQVTSGTVRGILNDQTPFTIDLDPGAPISGTMFFDLAAAPAPVVTTGNSTSTTIAQTDGAQWVTGFVNQPLPALPAGALPIPSVFPLDRRLNPGNGTPGTPNGSSQRVQYVFAPGAASALFTAKFDDTWASPTDQVQHDVLLALLLTQNTNFFPQAPGVQPFATGASLGGSTFQYIDFHRFQDQTPPLFGITSNYTVTTTFTITGADATLVPEPGTWGLCLGALGLLGLIHRRAMGR